MNPIELRRKMAAKAAEARAIYEKAETEKRDVSDEEKSAYQALIAEAHALQAEAKRLEELEGFNGPTLPENDDPRFASSRNGREQPEQTSEFRAFGDFLQTVRWRPGDSGLTYRESIRQSEGRAMSMGVGVQGGFLVPEQFSTEILRVMPEDAIFRPRARVIPAGDPPDAAITFPALDQSGDNGVYGGVTVAWISEGELKPETTPAFREIKLEPNEVAAHVIITDKLLRNSAAAGSLVSSLLRQAIIGAEEDAFLTGDGIGKPLGIIGHPAAIDVARATANQVSYADVVAMYAAAKFGGRLAWIGSTTTLPQLMTMEDTGNNLIWQPNAREGAPGTLLGIPFMINDQSPPLGSHGDLILVDLNYYLIKDGSGITVAMSEHPYFTSNKTVIKAFWNVDGQPWLTGPILQRNGVTSVSPFVVLQ